MGQYKKFECTCRTEWNNDKNGGKDTFCIYYYVHCLCSNKMDYCVNTH